MVKFSFLALAAATIGAATASVVKKNIKLGNRSLRRGDPATEALLKKAVPYKKSGGSNNNNLSTIDNKVSRRLEDNNNNGIDGSYYIQFSECMDVKLYDEDLFDENIINYVKNGQIVAAKSYVLFHVCQQDSCYLESDEDLYLVDLATYMTNIAQYYANKRTDYCEQCQEYEDYCNPEQEEEEEAAAEEEEEPEEEEAAEEEEAEEDEGEEEEEPEEEGEEEGDARRQRKLSERKLNRKLASAIDCNQCATYECFNNQEDLDDQVQRNENLDEAVSEWIGNLAECQQTGTMWDNMNLYVGAMCDQYGDGVELAVFANEDCTWYTNQYAFNDVYSFNANADANDDNAGDNANDNSINYLMYAEEFIKSAFSELTPCAQLQFANPYGEEEEDDGDEENEMNDYCQGVLEENAVSFANCAADDEEEEQNNNAAYNYDWFTYDMEEADDAADVCVMLKKKQSGDGYSHAYDQESSGSWYTRDKSGHIVTGAAQKEGLSAGAIVGIVIAVLAVLLVAVGIGRSCSSSRKRHVDTDYSGGEMS